MVLSKVTDRPIVIATRASRLAVWQAEHVQDLLRKTYPGLEVSLLKLSTRGDEILDRSLQKVGGKGLFIKELENALADGRADLAVHSLKDVPVVMPEGFTLACILPRAEPRDAWVSGKYASIEDLPAGAVVGTSSLRREAQIRRRRPDVVVKPLRGNLDTRLGKLDDGQFDAIILAAIGLQRLRLESRIRMILPVDLCLPAAGQGTLGIEVSAGREDMVDLLMPLACQRSTAVSIAERAVSRVLGGSCSVPLAAHATLQSEGGELIAADAGLDSITDAGILVRALVASPDGADVLESSVFGPVSQANQLGEQAARILLDDGAAQLLQEHLQDD
ncbi:hydroxymethylbilane synthase [Orrella marina]|uniref:Porphobilinogen deaminase n=1 Tax=Orrella marina TaxID=2163011 RepID=A0A2R4XGH8_9BURK|nr:hydroxymethylbilane synthase [Orrella marina]AWB32881.1 hydroxymethylbilane synthase [Orrella marina]